MLFSTSLALLASTFHGRERGVAFGAQAGEHPCGLGGLAVERGVEQPEHVEARGVGHQRLHAFGIQRLSFGQQRQLVDFLRGGAYG